MPTTKSDLRTAIAAEVEAQRVIAAYASSDFTVEESNVPLREAIVANSTVVEVFPGPIAWERNGRAGFDKIYKVNLLIRRLMSIAGTSAADRAATVLAKEDELSALLLEIAEDLVDFETGNLFLISVNDEGEFAPIEIDATTSGEFVQFITLVFMDAS